MSFGDILKTVLGGGGSSGETDTPDAGMLVSEDGGGPVVISGDDSGALVDEQQQKTLLQIQKDCHHESQWARRYSTRRIRKSREYWKGRQYVWWDEELGQYQPFRYPPAANNAAGDQPEENSDKSLNFYRAFGLYIIAAGSSEAPTTRFYPSDAEDPLDIATAKSASDIVELFDRINDIQKRLHQEFWYLYNDGIFGYYVRHTKSAQRFGTHDEPIIMPMPAELTPEQYRCPECGNTTPAAQVRELLQCPSCGAGMDPFAFIPAQQGIVPQQVGTKPVPNGNEVIDIIGGLELRVPPDAPDFQDYEYLTWVTEVPASALKALYPKLADKIKGGTSGYNDTDEQERLTRLALKERTGRAGTGVPVDEAGQKVTYYRTWLRPSAFFRITDKDLRKKLIDAFPDGAFIATAGDLFLEARNESMDDHWGVCHAHPGDGQVRESIGDVLLDCQDVVNDLVNLEIDAARHGTPTVLVDSALLNLEEWSQTAVQPGAFYPVSRPDPNRPLMDGVAVIQPGSASPAGTALRQELQQQVPQFLVGAQPAMMGAEMSTQRTASGYRMARDQALGRLGLVYRSIKEAHVRMATLAVKNFIASRTEDVTIPDMTPAGFKNRRIRLEDLRGQIIAYPESDEAYPIAASDKREVVSGFLASNNPTFGGAASSPENFEFMKGIMGLAGLKLPGEGARKKQNREIEILLTQQPTPGPPDPMTGQPGPDQPSIPVQDIDDHEGEYNTVQSWSQTDAAYEAQQSNPSGYANVMAHAAAHKAAGMPPPMPPGGPGGGPPGGGGGGGGQQSPGPQGPGDATLNQPQQAPPVDGTAAGPGGQ